MPATTLAEALERLPPTSSIGLFAPRRADALPGAAAFLRSGLARGEKCLLLCSRRLSDEILRALRALGSDVAAALGRGTLVVDREPRGRDGEDASLHAALDGAVRLAAAEGRGALRVLVDVPHALGTGDGPALADAAGRLQAFLSGSGSPSLFVYPEDELPSGALLPLLSCHPWFLRDHNLAENVYFAAPRPGGERPDPAERYRDRVRHLLERHDEITRLERQAIRLSRLRDISLSLLSRADTADLYRGVVEGVVALGHAMCWVGMARPDGSVEPVASSEDLGYLREISVRWDATAEGRGPVGLSIRHRRPEVVPDTARSRRFAPWRRSAEARGYRAVAAFPIEEGGRAVGALAVYSTRAGAFGAAEVEELSSFALMASLVLQRGREFGAVAESEERLRRLFEQIPAACFTFDRDGVVREWNLHCRRLFGLPAEEAVGRPLGRLVLREEDHAEARRVLGRVFSGEPFYNLEWEAHPPGRPRRIVQANVFPFREPGGAVEEGACVAVDVTERVEALLALRESEGKYRSLVESAGVCVIETGSDHRVRLFNRAAERVTGYAREEVLGKEYLLLVPERERERSLERFRGVASGRAMDGEVHPLRTRDGGERSLAWHVRPLSDPAGGFAGVLSIGVDVHEKLRLDRDREEARRRTEQARRMEALASLAHGMAGRFDGVLAAVLRGAALVEGRTGGDEELRRAVEAIRSAAGSAKELTGKLAAFARPGRAGKAPFLLDGTAARVAGILALEALPGLRVECARPEGPVVVEGDEGRVEEAILALCVNGRDAMPAGGTLSVSAGSSEVGEEEGRALHLPGPGWYAWVEVGDTGRGMTGEEADRAFDPLYTTKGEGSGAGMGLPLVYRTARDHGGGVTVESAPDRGTRFRLWLPALERRRDPRRKG